MSLQLDGSGRRGRRLGEVLRALRALGTGAARLRERLAGRDPCGPLLAAVGRVARERVLEVPRGPGGRRLGGGTVRVGEGSLALAGGQSKRRKGENSDCLSHGVDLRRNREKLKIGVDL